MIEEIFQTYTIKVGRNKNENDRLITDASADDYWIHLSDFPSGHGIIVSQDEKKIPQKVLKRACCLVKQYSKYSSMKKMSFDITQIKHIEKTKNKGQVLVHHLIKNIII